MTSILIRYKISNNLGDNTMKKAILLITLLCTSVLLGTPSKEVTPVKASKSVKTIQPKGKALRKLNVFFTNFSESAVPFFKKGTLSEDELIAFGVRHNLINISKNVHKTKQKKGYDAKISVKAVHRAVMKYFGKKILKDHSVIAFYQELSAVKKVPASFLFEKGFYYIPITMGQFDMARNPTGEQMKFIQVDHLIPRNKNLFEAVVNRYAIYPDSISKTTKELNHLMFSVPVIKWKVAEKPTLEAKIKALIRQGKNGRYQLISYIQNVQ